MEDLKQFDIVYVDLNNGKNGSEQNGCRPACIVQNNVGNAFSPTLLVVPLTSSIKKLNQPTHALIKPSENNGLRKKSMALGEQLTSLSKERVVKKIGHLDNYYEQEKIVGVYLANICGKNITFLDKVISSLPNYEKEGEYSDNNIKREMRRSTSGIA